MLKSGTVTAATLQESRAPAIVGGSAPLRPLGGGVRVQASVDAAQEVSPRTSA